MEKAIPYGTKIKANVNKYTFVWRKSTVRYEEKLQAKIEDNLLAIEDTTAIDIEALKLRNDPTYKYIKGKKNIVWDLLRTSLVRTQIRML